MDKFLIFHVALDMVLFLLTIISAANFGYNLGVWGILKDRAKTGANVCKQQLSASDGKSTKYLGMTMLLGVLTALLTMILVFYRG